MLDDKHKKIQEKIQENYVAIKAAEESLEFLRKTCEHPETETCTYQWGGPGHNIEGATICSVCGKLLKTPFDDINLDNNIPNNVDIKSLDDDDCSTELNEDSPDFHGCAMGQHF